MFTHRLPAGTSSAGGLPGRLRNKRPMRTSAANARHIPKTPPAQWAQHPRSFPAILERMFIRCAITRKSPTW